MKWLPRLEEESNLDLVASGERTLPSTLTLGRGSCSMRASTNPRVLLNSRQLSPVHARIVAGGKQRVSAGCPSRLRESLGKQAYNIRSQETSTAIMG